MKKRKLLWTLAAAAALPVMSCDENNCDSVNVYINSRDAQNKATTHGERLTAKEICKLEELQLHGRISTKDENGEIISNSDCTYNFTVEDIDSHWDVGWIDTAKCRLRFRPTIINYFEVDRENHCFFWENCDFVIEEARGNLANAKITDARKGCTPTWDTVAYVPTAQRMAVVDELLELFNDKEENWDRICELFNEAFVFIPCTGEEYRALAAAGLN